MSRVVGHLFLCLVALGSACSKGDSNPPATEAAPALAEPAPEPAAPPVPQGPVGSIRGKVTLTGQAPEMKPLKRGSDAFCARTEAMLETVVVDANGGLQNVVVRIKPGTITGAKPTGPVVVDQTECMYRPRVQVGMVGQTLELRNSDETFHNIHARARGLEEGQGIDTVFNRGQPSKGPVLKNELPSVEILELKCDAHGWMKGFVVVSDHPYAAVSGKDGSFVLENVPVGEHELSVWHELYGVKSGTVTVEEGKAATIDFSYEALPPAP